MDNWEFYKQTCPKSIVSENENTIVFTDDIPCSYLSQLMERDGVVVEEDENNFIFKFETDGSLRAVDVLKYALKRLPERFTSLMESLSD
jgi:DNA-directed RNA polymerase subunit D